MGKIATEAEAAAIGELAGVEEGLESRLCTKVKAEEYGCRVEGDYEENQCVQLLDIYPALEPIDVVVGNGGFEITNKHISPNNNFTLTISIVTDVGTSIHFTSEVVSDRKVYVTGEIIKFLPSVKDVFSFDFNRIQVAGFNNEGITGHCKVIDYFKMDFNGEVIEYPKGTDMYLQYFQKFNWIYGDSITIEGVLTVNDSN